MLSDKVSLLIPTMNRPNFLIRLLNYYKEVGYKGNIIIGDSSNPKFLKQNKKTIKIFQEQLNINYCHETGLDECRTMKKLSAVAQTTYSAWLADDDFAIPNGLEQCADFLDKNKSYNSAWGRMIKMQIKNDQVYGQIAFCKQQNYKLKHLESETASQRLIDYAANGYHHYVAVFRNEVLKDIFKNAHKVKHPKEAGGGDTMAFAAIMHGRRRILNCLIHVTQVGEYQWKKNLVRNKSHYLDWFLTTEWINNYQTLINTIPEELAALDGISKEKATEVVKEAFRINLIRTLGSKNMKEYNSLLSTPPYQLSFHLLKSIWNSKINSNPILKKIKKLKYFLPGYVDMSLSGLLDPSSPYHKDFMPVYRSVTSPFRK